MFQIISLILFLTTCLFAWLWWIGSGWAFSEDQRKNNLLDRYGEQICQLQMKIFELQDLNEKKFPFKRYEKIKTELFSYLGEVENAHNMDVVQEAEEFMSDLSEKEKEFFEYELEGLEKKIYAAKNKFCSYCGGHGVIGSDVEVLGRIIDDVSTCKYCNGSGQF